MNARGYLGPLPESEAGSVYGYVMRRLHDRNFSYQEIADGSGVNKRTVEKIARKEIEDPGVSHIEKLAAFFQSRHAKAA